MAKKHTDKIPLKRAAWIQRTAAALGVTESEAADILRTERRQSLRLNPLQGDPERTLANLNASGFSGEPYAWAPDCYTVTSTIETMRDSSDVTAGRAFIQNAASWIPVLALDPRPGDLILDVCAAPGGKTSHIAAMTQNQARIWANDNSRPRLAKLQANMQRLNAQIERYALYDATQLARKLEGEQFDRILLDAPCSGEGLMQLDRDADFATWSVAHIKRLQQLQKRILVQVWQLLKPGGTLVYSTCTMAPEEDESVVDYLLRSQSDAQIVRLELNLPNRVPTVREWNGKTFAPEAQGCMRLKPSEQIEAFFVCKLQKVDMAHKATYSKALV
ncbi:MAG TPA: RsmB/NOP family class I SAM-dependent RNA methyltransferase [Candidatus Saccharimonadales bacterium]